MDLDAIRLSDATENVIELMSEQLMQLPEETWQSYNWLLAMGQILKSSPFP